MSYVVGFDIGGTKIAVSLADLDGEILRIVHKVKFFMPQNCGYLSVLERMLDTFQDIMKAEQLTQNDIQGIGISCGGPLDSRNGVILSPPNLVGWDHVPIVDYFQSRLQIPTYLQNDADACALAEWKFGAGRGTQNMIFLTFGTGLGAGLILNGQLYSGTSNMAGEIGHCRSPMIDNSPYSPIGYGKAGSFEGFCSGGGIADLGRAVLKERFQKGLSTTFCSSIQDLKSVDAKVIGDAAEAGDPVALEIYRCSGRHLGAALSILVDLLNPEAIVIGSIYTRSTELLRESALSVLNREALEPNRSVCRILPAALGENLGDVAAATIALSAERERPAIAYCQASTTSA